MKKKTFVVDRATWLNGSTRYVTKQAAQLAKEDGYDLAEVATTPEGVLLDPASKMKCCLGFVCEQLGVPTGALKDHGMPEAINTRHFKKLEGVLLVDQEHPYGGRGMVNTRLGSSASGINDSRFSNELREEKLIKLFAENGYTLKFKGKYPKGPIVVKG